MPDQVVTPERPVVIFDGRCSFCRRWIEYFQALTAGRLDYVSAQERGVQSPQSVQLEQPGGERLSGAHAVFEILRHSPGLVWLAWVYANLPLFGAVSEWAYRVIAGHRPFFDRLTTMLFGRTIRPLSYVFVEWIFLRVLGVIYFIAFVSFGTQVRGLIGSRGILPVHNYLQAVSESFGFSRFWVAPTLFWFRHDDGFVVSICIAGAALAIVLMLGYAQRLAMVLLFILYLSLCAVGQDFMSFQWDMLLLEAGFLAIFLGSSNIIIWLMRWLVFRLMFLSGAVKLMSHDPAWRSLDAMRFHYWTQPLPTPIAWYMNQLPAWFLRASTAGVFVIELLVPFLIFSPRRVRHLAGYCLIFLQVLILTTGNYTFFNWLAIALCLFLFDDDTFPKWHVSRRALATSSRVAVALAILIAILSVFQLLGSLFDYTPLPARALLRLAAPFGIVNTYGLFAVMTTERPEIIVQGSQDGVNWLDYGFRYKPGDPRRPPPWVAPHQPRLDWQMWFAALSNWRGNPWFANFMVRLLEASPEVLALMEKNPFPGTQPKYVRALVYAYRFTDFAERRATREWWHREPKGTYFPAISLNGVRP